MLYVMKIINNFITCQCLSHLNFWINVSISFHHIPVTSLSSRYKGKFEKKYLKVSGNVHFFLFK